MPSPPKKTTPIDPPPQARRWAYLLWGGLVGLLGLWLGFSAGVQMGWGDPPDYPHLLWAGDWPAGTPFPLDPPPSAFSLSLQTGPHESPMRPWGLWLRHQAGGYSVMALNTAGRTGYISAQVCPAPVLSLECRAYQAAGGGGPTQWKQNLFLRPGQANELRLYLKRGGGASVWVNREWMWDLPPWGPVVAWGLMGEGGGKLRITGEAE